MGKPFVVGIAGGTASGKSTFCGSLEKSLSALNVKCIHMDDYFKSENERPYSEAFVSGKKYMDDNHPLTVDLEKLKHDVKNLLCKNIDVVIIEGLLTLWDREIYGLLDLKLFVDCRADERIVRRIRRNTEWGQTFGQITDVYLDMVRYRHDEYVEPSKWRADIIINGSNMSDKSVPVICGYICANCRA
jgi:uridine kinase